MNHVDAYKLLYDELAVCRDMGYAQLQALVSDDWSHHKISKNDVEYELSIQIRWRNREQGDIRVAGIVGETSWGAPHDSVHETMIIPRETENEH
jgi:hypothetical protein